MATEQEIREVKRRHSARLLSEPGVVGVGIEKSEDGGYVLAVHLADDPADLSLPPELDGQPVKYVRSGPYRKFSPAD